jgi:DNA-binding MarR family transcriptional regulator
VTGATEGDRPDEAKGDLKTITLTKHDIKAAAHLLHLLVGAEEGRGREINTLARGNVHRMGDQNDRMGDQNRSAYVERAHQVYVNRARRSQVFKSAMFGEAAWDMLLALYITDQSGARHTVSGLASLSGVPPTTALRWLDFLEKEELVGRRPKLTDARVTLIELTDKARDLLDTYFSGTAPERK